MGRELKVINCSFIISFGLYIPNIIGILTLFSTIKFGIRISKVKQFYPLDFKIETVRPVLVSYSTSNEFANIKK